MKAQGKLYRPVIGVALVTGCVLMVPLVAMQYTNDVKWDLPDFLLMGALIFGTGMAVVTIMRQSSNVLYRLGAAVGMGAAFLMVWANLAVGLVGSGPNLANLMYAGVVAIGIAGVTMSRFMAHGMERTMYAVAGSLLLLAVIALLAGVHHRTDSSVAEILGVNAFFAALFSLAGLLFRYAAKQRIRVSG